MNIDHITIISTKYDKNHNHTSTCSTITFVDKIDIRSKEKCCLKIPLTNKLA